MCIDIHIHMYLQVDIYLYKHITTYIYIELDLDAGADALELLEDARRVPLPRERHRCCCRVQDLEFWVESLGFGVWGLGFRV